MPDSQNFIEILNVLGEALRDKRVEINGSRYVIESLKEKVAAAEEQIEELKKGTENE